MLETLESISAARAPLNLSPDTLIRIVVAIGQNCVLSQRSSPVSRKVRWDIVNPSVDGKIFVSTPGAL